MSGNNVGGADGSTEAFGESPETSRDAADSTISCSKNFNDILHEYIALELGNSKKDLFNLIHVGQSMQISHIENTTKLLNTVLNAKIVNSQLEVDFASACIEADGNETSSKRFQANDDKKEPPMSIDSFVLQFTHLEDSNFKNQFLVTRHSFQIICNHLMQTLRSDGDTCKKSDINVEKQLLVTLTYLGTVQSYKEIGSKFNIAVSTAHKCVNDITNMLFMSMTKLIFWPTDQQVDSEVRAFNDIPGNRFPDVLGVIGTIDLKKSCTANPSKQTKDGSSIAIQCVCNSRYQFYNVFTSYLPKSSVTTTMFLESPLGEKILNNPFSLFPCVSTHIVGPCCYPLLPNLMTPFSSDTFVTEAQQNYNDAIETPLNVIKFAFGKLLGRFKRLMCLDLWGQEKSAILVFAACCLHNLCMGNDDDVDCEPYECCNFICEYYDEFSVQKREQISNSITYEY